MASSLPPTMTVRVPSAAPCPPPLTGASIRLSPYPCACRDNFWHNCGCTVEWTTRQPPPGIAGISCSHTCCTPRSSTTQMAQQVTCLASEAMLSAQVAVVPAKGCRVSGRRAQSTTSRPASIMRCAIGAPWLPKPIKPNFPIAVSPRTAFKEHYHRLFARLKTGRGGAEPEYGIAPNIKKPR